jgi:hypothetical protein
MAADHEGLDRAGQNGSLSLDVLSKSSSHSLTPEHVGILSVLVDLICPADGNGPSASDIGVAETLTQWCSSSSEQACLYSEGLGYMNALSRHMYSEPFTKLLPNRQQAMLRHLDNIQAHLSEPATTITARAHRKLRFLYYSWQGSLKTADFWLQLRRDFIRVYYSHSLTWKWLGYVGPPFPKGYANDLR